MQRLPDTLTDNEIEAVEKLSMRWATEAMLNFVPNAWDEFNKSPAAADGVAEQNRNVQSDYFS